MHKKAGNKMNKNVKNVSKIGGFGMKEENVGISGEQAKTFYEFVRAHNVANDGMRLGQRFVSLYLSKPWPELFYEESDKKAMELIEKYLTDYQYGDKMPLKRKRMGG